MSLKLYSSWLIGSIIVLGLFYLYTCPRLYKEKGGITIIGKIYLIDTQSGKIIKSYELYHLRRDRDEKKKLWDNFFSKGDDRYLFDCGCNNNIKFSIDKSYKLRPKKIKTSEVHHNFCPEHGKYKDLIYNSGWDNKGDNDVVTATLDFNLKPSFSINKKEKETTEECQYNGVRGYKFTETTGELTLSALGKKMSMFAWERMVLNRNRFPENKEELLSMVFGASNFIELKGKGRGVAQLKTLFYDGQYKNMGRW